MASLTLALTIDELINMMMRAQSAEWLEGLTSYAAKQLAEKRKPDGTVGLEDEKISSNKVRMGASEHPSKLLDRTKAAETRFSAKASKIKQEELIVVSLSQATMACRCVFTSEQCMSREQGVDTKVKK